MKNLAQFKRWVAKGKEIEFVENRFKGASAELGVRKINKVQTNAFTTITLNGKDSFLDYPKAKHMKFNDDGTIDFLSCEKMEFEHEGVTAKEGDMWLKIRPINV